MSQQAQPYPNPAYGAHQQHRPTVSGLGIAAGILGILSSLWVTILGLGMSFFAVDYGGVFAAVAGTFAAVFFVLALLMFVLGIMIIVKNRQRGVKLLAALLGSAVVSVVAGFLSDSRGLVGPAFSYVTAGVMLPLIVVSILAFLAARKAAKAPEPQS